MALNDSLKAPQDRNSINLTFPDSPSNILPENQFYLEVQGKIIDGFAAQAEFVRKELGAGSATKFEKILDDMDGKHIDESANFTDKKKAFEEGLKEMGDWVDKQVASSFVDKLKDVVSSAWKVVKSIGSKEFNAALGEFDSSVKSIRNAKRIDKTLKAVDEIKEIGQRNWVQKVATPRAGPSKDQQR